MHDDFFFAESANIRSIPAFSSQAPLRWQDMSAQTRTSRAGRRSEVEMRVEAGDTMYPIQGEPAAARKVLEFGGREIAVLALDGLELLENHRASLAGADTNMGRSRGHGHHLV